MIDKNAAYKYETPYEGPFIITQCSINITVILQCSTIKIRYNIRHIKPHTYDTNFEDIN